MPTVRPRRIAAASHTRRARRPTGRLIASAASRIVRDEASFDSLPPPRPPPSPLYDLGHKRILPLHGRLRTTTLRGAGLRAVVGALARVAVVRDVRRVHRVHLDRSRGARPALRPAGVAEAPRKNVREFLRTSGTGRERGRRMVISPSIHQPTGGTDSGGLDLDAVSRCNDSLGVARMMGLDNATRRRAQSTGLD